jgi:CubicO group peptidase (beta-lactamase class C family)
MAGDGTGWSAADGLASRRFGILDRPDTPFGIASGTKGLTALTVIASTHPRPRGPGCA